MNSEQNNKKETQIDAREVIPNLKIQGRKVLKPPHSRPVLELIFTTTTDRDKIQITPDLHNLKLSKRKYREDLILKEIKELRGDLDSEQAKKVKKAIREISKKAEDLPAVDETPEKEDEKDPEEPELSEEEKEEARELLKNPDLLRVLDQDLGKNIVGERRTRLLTFFLMLSKDLDKKQHIIFTAGPGGGKSHIINTVAGYFSKSVKSYTRMTSRALDHLAEDLSGKILVVQEFPGADEAGDALRPLLSADQSGLKLLVPEKNPDGSISSKEKNLQGEPVFVSSSVELGIEEQMRTRVWNLWPDDSSEQTRRVIKHKAQRKAKPWEADPEPDPSLINAIKELKPVGVVVPYAEHIDFPVDKIRARRDADKLFALIETIAYFHQHQRPIFKKNGKRYIIAGVEDFQIAKSLAQEVLESTYTEVDHRLYSLIDLLRAEGPHTINQTLEHPDFEGWGYDSLYGAYNELCNRGLVIKEKKQDDKRINIYRLREKSQRSLRSLKNAIKLRDGAHDVISAYICEFVGPGEGGDPPGLYSVREGVGGVLQAFPNKESNFSPDSSHDGDKPPEKSLKGQNQINQTIKDVENYIREKTPNGPVSLDKILEDHDQKKKTIKEALKKLKEKGRIAKTRADKYIILEGEPLEVEDVDMTGGKKK